MTCLTILNEKGVSFMLWVKNVSKIYQLQDCDKRVVDNVTLRVEKGEFVSIMGPSGCGKTTLMNIMSTINNDYQGQVMINDKSIHSLDDKSLAKIRNEKIGFIFQDYNLLDTLTIQENIVLPKLVGGNKMEAHLKDVEKIAISMGIGDILHHYPYQTSGGQQQRASCARALINNPEIIFADEPTGALDSEMSQSILEILNQMSKTFQKSVIMVTHDAYAGSYSDKVYLMKDGRFEKELLREDKTQEAFYKTILENQMLLRGNGL